jgi:hypothetical protein
MLWAGLFSPVLGLFMLVCVVRDFKRGKSEPIFAYQILSLFGVQSVARSKSPVAFTVSLLLNCVTVAILLVVAPIWAVFQ